MEKIERDRSAITSLVPDQETAALSQPGRRNRYDDREEADGRVAGEEERRRRNMIHWRNEDESPLKLYERRMEFGTNAKCTICGEGAAVSVRWALCGGCLRSGRANVSISCSAFLICLEVPNGGHKAQLIGFSSSIFEPLRRFAC